MDLRRYSFNIHQKRSLRWSSWSSLMCGLTCLVLFSERLVVLVGGIISAGGTTAAAETDGLLWHGKIPFLKGNLNGNLGDTVVLAAVEAGEKLGEEYHQPISASAAADSASSHLRSGSKTTGGGGGGVGGSGGITGTSDSHHNNHHHHHHHRKGKLWDRVLEILRSSPLIDG